MLSEYAKASNCLVDMLLYCAKVESEGSAAVALAKRDSATEETDGFRVGVDIEILLAMLGE